MATKANGVPCYDKAAPNEELFVLRSQDQLAPNVVRYWAYLAAGNPPFDFGLPVPTAAHPANKITEALDVAGRMEAWPHRKLPD